MNSVMSRRGFVAGVVAATAAAGTGMPLAAEAQTQWDTSYDVIVIGYGIAGATAARHAADAGATVLLVDGAPDGAEGGNSKFAKQLLASGHDVESALAYLKALNAGFDVPEDMLRLFAERMVDLPAYCAEYLDCDVYSWRGRTDDPVLTPFVPEYPELPGANEFDAYTISETSGDGALWFKAQELVEERHSLIDVWTASPARHLVQDPETRTVIGAIIEHEGKDLGIQANRGVVLACGGFEFNPQMIQDYLGASRLYGLGSPYNQGDGIRMALEVGADLWHMKSYEPGSHTLMFDPGDGSNPLGAGAIPVTGSTLYVGSDGSRYCNEQAENRHGRVKQGGEFKPVDHPNRPWFVWDQTRMDELTSEGLVDAMPILSGPRCITAQTLEELAETCAMDPQTLVQTIEHFNFFAAQGCDYQYGRDPQTLRAFDDGPYYAVAGCPLILNTQGGPRRNARAQVIGASGEPIGHLYSAGELGSLNAFQYQGGNNLAECLIFGRIAGENAAASR